MKTVYTLYRHFQAFPTVYLINFQPLVQWMKTSSPGKSTFRLWLAICALVYLLYVIHN